MWGKKILKQFGDRKKNKPMNFDTHFYAYEYIPTPLEGKRQEDKLK